MEDIVSVVIPTYGGGQYLGRCIESVLNQTYPYIEVIVVDDNGIGTPNQVVTEQIMTKYKENSRVRYICHKVNINGSAARNTGVRNSSGRYIALLDDDDVFYPQNIEEHMRVLPYLSDDYALSYCGHDEYIDDKKLREVCRLFSGQDLYGLFLHKIVVGSTSMCIRRSTWESLGGFDESFFRHQDWEFSARLMSQYKVKALSHIGFRRYIVQRNSPKKPELVISYRKYYLEKMKPIIEMLSKKQQRDIVVYNMLDAFMVYIKCHRYRDFLKNYYSLHPGYRGVCFLFFRVKTILKRGYIKINKYY